MTENDATAPPAAGNTASVAAGIYGTIIAASVLAASSDEPMRNTVAFVIVTVLVYWLSEQYAAALAQSLAGHPAPRAAVTRGLREGWPMVQASYLPVAVLIGCWAIGLDNNTSINIAMSACVVVLFVLGFRGGIKRGLPLRGRLISAAIAGSFGVAVVLLKLVVSH